MLNGQTAVIEDVFADPRIPHDAYRRTFVKSLIMTPVGESNVAAIGAYWRDQRAVQRPGDHDGEDLQRVVGEALSNC